MSFLVAHMVIPQTIWKLIQPKCSLLHEVQYRFGLNPAIGKYITKFSGKKCHCIAMYHTCLRSFLSFLSIHSSAIILFLFIWISLGVVFIWFWVWGVCVYWERGEELSFQARQKQNKNKIHSRLRPELILQLGIYCKDFGFILLDTKHVNICSPISSLQHDKKKSFFKIKTLRYSMLQLCFLGALLCGLLFGQQNPPFFSSLWV